MNVLLLTIIVIVYLFIIGYLAYTGYKGTKTASDYMVAGRSIHPYIMALSYGATFISTSAIVGFGGAAAVFGMGLLWLTFLNIFVGIFIAFAFFGKRTRLMGHNMNSHTFPEFIAQRFQSKFLQGTSGLLIFIGMPLYAAVVLMGGAKFIAAVLSIGYEPALFAFTVIIAIYVIMGGLKGVMYTDAFQGSIMFIGMTILLFITYSNLGGIVNAHTQLSNLSDVAVKIFGAKGHVGWTAMPTLGSGLWWTLVSTIILGVGIGVLAQPQLVVRFMTVKSDKELNRAILIGGIFILMMTGVAFIVGALSNVYFMNHPDFQNISIVAAAKNVGNIIPLYIKNAMPQWFTAVFMITLLSAAMSTLSSQFHAMGTSIGRDVYQKWLGGKGKPIFITQMGILVVIIISFFLAWGLPKFYAGGTAIIARGTAIFFGLCASAFLPMYIGALYFKKMTKQAAITGFITGFLVSFFWLFFVHISEAQPLGLCKAIFGVDALSKFPWIVVDPLLIALPCAIIATITAQVISSKTGKALPEKHVNQCFLGIK